MGFSTVKEDDISTILEKKSLLKQADNGRLYIVEEKLLNYLDILDEDEHDYIMLVALVNKFNNLVKDFYSNLNIKKLNSIIEGMIEAYKGLSTFLELDREMISYDEDRWVDREGLEGIIDTAMERLTEALKIYKQCDAIYKAYTTSSLIKYSDN